MIRESNTTTLLALLIPFTLNCGDSLKQFETDKAVDFTLESGIKVHDAQHKLSKEVMDDQVTWMMGHVGKFTALDYMRCLPQVEVWENDDLLVENRPASGAELDMQIIISLAQNLDGQSVQVLWLPNSFLHELAHAMEQCTTGSGDDTHLDKVVWCDVATYYTDNKETGDETYCNPGAQ